MHQIAIKERIENWQFARCRCGLVLAHSDSSGKTYWLRAGKPARRISDDAALAHAMEGRCRVNNRPVRSDGRAPASA